MVGLAPGRWDRAALGAALAVPDDYRLALRRSEQPRGSAEVEDLGLRAEHRWDDPGGAGEPSYLCGAQPVRGTELAGAELLAQRLERDGEDQRGRVPAVSGQPLGVEHLHQRTERLPALAVDRDPVGLSGSLVSR